MVHIHAEGPAFFCWIPKLFGKRVISTIHGLDWAREKWKFGVGSKFIRQGEKNAVKYADEIIVLSKDVQKYFLETYGKVDGYSDAPWQIDSDEVIVLHVLAVHPNHRGKGLARKLVENVIEQERKAGKKALRLDVIENNTTAEKLYQKLGFRYIQAKTLYYDVVGEMTFKLYELVL